MAEDRNIAGIRCMQVLEKLDDFVDGSLDADDREQLERHLQGCDWCTKFGGEYSTLVSTLRAGLRSKDELDSSIAGDLAARLLSGQS